VNAAVTIQCDASQSCLGAILLPAGQPVAFASRALTQTEHKYAQFENECLAVVSACNRFDQYLYGRDKRSIRTQAFSYDFQEANSHSPKETTKNVTSTAEVFT